MAVHLVRRRGSALFVGTPAHARRLRRLGSASYASKAGSDETSLDNRDGGAATKRATEERADAVPNARNEEKKREWLKENLRVDHAGEFGAVRIYQGQIAVLGNTAEGPTLQDMIEHEKNHLSTFQSILPRYRTRPTALLPLWSLGGFALGAVSAMLGKREAYAVTQAVEESICEHYNDQIRELHNRGWDSDEAELKKIFIKFRDEEQEHLDTAVANDSEGSPLYKPISAFVKATCKAAILASKKL